MRSEFCCRRCTMVLSECRCRRERTERFLGASGSPLAKGCRTWCRGRSPGHALNPSYVSTDIRDHDVSQRGHRVVWVLQYRSQQDGCDDEQTDNQDKHNTGYHVAENALPG